MYCWGGSSEKPYGQKDLSREDLSQGGEVVMRFLRTICVLAIMLIASLPTGLRSEEHTSELQSRFDLVCRLLLEKKKKNINLYYHVHKNFHNPLNPPSLKVQLVHPLLFLIR